MTCRDCIHGDICANRNRMVQIDEHTWDEYEQVDDVENFCSHAKNKADYAEVKHGKWLITDSFDHHKTPIYQCSACRKEVADGYIQFHKHCLHCGTKMDGMNLSDIPTGSEGSSDNEQSI